MLHLNAQMRPNSVKRDLIAGKVAQVGPCVCAMCVCHVCGPCVWAMCVGHVCGRTEGNVNVDVGVAGNIKSNST